MVSLNQHIHRNHTVHLLSCDSALITKPCDVDKADNSFYSLFKCHSFTSELYWSKVKANMVKKTNTSR